MNSALEAALCSWSFKPMPMLVLAAAVLVYARGWRQLHRQVPQRFPRWRLFAYLAAIAALFLAIASPLDAFAGLLLQAHMIQHLLLMMVAPPLLLLGSPWLPLLCGLPRTWVRDGLGPFLTWPALRKLGRTLTHPLVAGPLFMTVNVVWHLPPLYETALRSQSWHEFEHACFLATALLFWWPVILPWPARASWPRWAVIPYLLVADLQNTALAAFLSFSGRVLYPSYEAAPRLWNISALDDQAASGAIMWVPGSLAFLIPAGLIAVQLLNARRGVRPREFFAQTTMRPVFATAQAEVGRASACLDVRTTKRAEAPAPAFDLLRAPSIGTIFRWPPFRRVAQAVMFLLALIVVADGLLGPQVSPLNLAGVLPWTHWRGLVVITLLVAGNFFCMACPFMLVRDLGRRILPGRWPWPGALRSKWLAVGLLALYLWAYEALSLWDSPRWTAWIIVGYFTAALTIDGLFRGASFCKYICPIGQFNFVQSLASPLEIRVREPEVCATCATHDCIRGNARQRGCELELYQPRKSGNMDCTFCLDCVKACPHDNVGILSGPPALDLTRDMARSSVGRFAHRPDLAALVLLLVFGAFVNAAGMIAPVMKWQEQLTARLGFHSSLPVVTTLMVLTLLVAPPLLALACGWWSCLLGSTPTHHQALLPLTCEFTMGLVPLGLAMWATHFTLHLVIGADSLWPAVQRAAADVGVGWLAVASPRFGFFQNSHEWLPLLRLLLLDAGLLLSLYLVWRIARHQSLRLRSRFGAFVPWAGLASALFLAGVWISTQPMQMRGVGVAMEDAR